MPSVRPLAPHPDRLLPADPAVRDIARRLYDEVRQLPIISPHGHVDASLLLEDAHFSDPASLLITPDHYVTRLLHAHGVPLDRLGVASGPLTEPASRAVWRELCSHWAAFRGTPVRYWLESELAEIFGVTDRPSAGTADAIYDQIAGVPGQPDVPAPGPLPAVRDRGARHDRRPGRRPGRARSARRRPDVARPGGADVPTGPLSRAGAARAGPTGSDGSARWRGIDTADYAGFVAALEDRRRYFIDARRHLGRPQPPSTCAPTRWTPAEARPHLPGRAARAAHARPRPPRSAGTCCWRWPGCRPRTGW